MRRQYDDGKSWKTWDTAMPEWLGRYGVCYVKALAEDLDFRADVYGRSQSATGYRAAAKRLGEKLIGLQTGGGGGFSIFVPVHYRLSDR